MRRRSAPFVSSLAAALVLALAALPPVQAGHDAASAAGAADTAGTADTASVATDPLADGLARYVVDARAAVAAIDAGAPAEAQAAAFAALADDAIALVEPFAARHPVCRDYLVAANGLRERWADLSPAQIEADYHHDGVLPAVADAGDRALCYQMKDLVVHPLTALRLLQEPGTDVAGLRHEIVEVVAHGGALAAMHRR